MNRKEWAFVWALLTVSLLTLVSVPPLDLSGVQAVAVQGSSTPTLAPTDIATSTITQTVTPIPPTATPTASVTATATATAKPSATATATATATPSPTPTATVFPFDVRADLEYYIYIDQYTQHMYIFNYGELYRDIPCSAGLPDSDKYTPAWSGEVGRYWGTFFAFDVYADDAWYLYKSAGSILIHSLPYTLDEEGNKIYQDRDALGVRPSSHGCIRIAPEDAEWLTAWNPEGVACTVSDPYLDKWR
ncbi:MAG: L,D-transpeptidase [Chloroflexi bacterium]|jgi:hypothetical protein|nr:L,D-transpeptidase [Chloroflexota bacterium]